MSSSAGFTLLETLLAITLLAVAIVGPMGLAIRSVGVSDTAANQIIAFYLAEEGVEYVRNTRDENFLNDRAWLTGLDDCMGADGCTVDVPAFYGNLQSCSGPCPLVRFDSSAGLYGHNLGVGEDTPFRRTVTLDDVVAGRETRVRSVIEWETRVGARSLTLQENIFNWRP